MGDAKSTRELVNDPARIGVVATTDREGHPNVAVFGSAHMPDDLTLVVALGETRTAQNLLENGRAVFMSVVPDANPMKTQGCRVYLKLRTLENEGPNLEAARARVAALSNEKAAAMIRYVAYFDIEAVRPLIDWSPNR